MSTTLAWKLFCRAGNATLTTVLSIKAMLEARIVADRIHGAACCVHGASALGDWTTASSQGGLMKDRHRGACGHAFRRSIADFYLELGCTTNGNFPAPANRGHRVRAVKAQQTQQNRALTSQNPFCTFER